jgi:hypothetical protein
MAFVKQMYPYAKAWSEKTGIPPQVFVAIGASETNWGRAGGFFGIKGASPSGRSQNYATWEVASMLVVVWLWLLALLPGGRWRVRMAAAHGATSFFPYSGESLPVAWATMNSDARRIPNACMSFPASID